MHARRLVVAAFTCMLITLGCIPRRTTAVPTAAPVNRIGGMFSEFGSLTSDDGNWVVKTSRTGESLVDYEICDAETGKVYVKAGGFSFAMRWCMYWDQENRLWVHNSDMGPLRVWVHDGTAFKAHDMTAGDPLLGSIPDVVANALPKSTLRHLELYE